MKSLNLRYARAGDPTPPPPLGRIDPACLCIDRKKLSRADFHQHGRLLMPRDRSAEEPQQQQQPGFSIVQINR
jgi:hypothetical protein